LNPATGEILLTTNNVDFVELLSTGNNLIPGNAVSLGAVANADFQDTPASGRINYAGLNALGSGGSLTSFSMGNVLPNGFSNLADLQLRYLNGSTEVFVGITLSSGSGDFDGDGDVDAADYVAWRKTDDTSEGYDAWRTNFGSGTSNAGPIADGWGATVPEASAITLAGLGVLGLIGRSLRHRNR
jgi:hypothetical protein